MRGGGKRDLLGAEGLHDVEALAAALEQDTDQVDDDVGVAHRRFDRRGIAQVGLHRVNLTDPAEWLQVACEVRPPHCDADAVMPLAEGPNEMAAEKAGPAKDGDQRVVVALEGHNFVWAKSLPARRD